MRTASWGVLFATTTAVIWGGQFVVGKSALAHVDAFPLSAIRYGLAVSLLLLLLVVVEGWKALRLEGRGWRLFALGSLGFAGFNLFAYTGLEHARPQSAALIVALGPLVTAIVLWVRDRVRPSRPTTIALVVAIAGVTLVVSGGHPETIFEGSIGWGDGLVLLGVISFVIYTLGAADHRDLSPLRYTALTAGLGLITIVAAALVAMASGLVATPSGGDVRTIVPEILYLAIPGALVAVLTWNAAVARIGPQNTALIGNLIPVTTFVIEIVRGYRPNAFELAGAAIAVGALTVNNLVARRRPVTTPQQQPDSELDLELELDAA